MFFLLGKGTALSFLVGPVSVPAEAGRVGLVRRSRGEGGRTTLRFRPHRLRNHRLLLDLVNIVEPRGRACRRLPADVPDVLVNDPGQAGPHEAPSPHVLRLLLDPAPLPRLAVPTYEFLQLFFREGMELLQPNQSETRRLHVLPPLEELVVDLPRAKKNPVRLSGLAVGEDGPEVTRGQILEPRDRPRVAEQALWGHDHKGLPERLLHLAPEEVEILGRGGGIADLEVLPVTELEKSLEPGARVLRTQALHPVGEKEYEAARPSPLGLAARDVEVDDGLGVVGEVPELGLPDD